MMRKFHLFLQVFNTAERIFYGFLICLTAESSPSLVVIGGTYDGRYLYRTHGRFLRADHRFGIRLRSAVEERLMSWTYLLSLILAIALFVYLVVALFFPEKF